jgi:hypothetical protein
MNREIKCRYIHTMEYNSAIKRNCYNMNSENILLCGKKKNHKTICKLVVSSDCMEEGTA